MKQGFGKDLIDYPGERAELSCSASRKSKHDTRTATATKQQSITPASHLPQSTRTQVMQIQLEWTGQPTRVAGLAVLPQDYR
jgi:hypothetical protein